jgi:hypothetical protein
LRYRAINGTVAPSSSKRIAVSTCETLIWSSPAIIAVVANISCIIHIPGKQDKKRADYTAILYHFANIPHRIVIFFNIMTIEQTTDKILGQEH